MRKPVRLGDEVIGTAATWEEVRALLQARGLSEPRAAQQVREFGVEDAGAFLLVAPGA